jgi:hypothetical protein
VIRPGDGQPKSGNDRAKKKSFHVSKNFGETEKNPIYLHRIILMIIIIIFITTLSF